MVTRFLYRPLWKDKPSREARHPNPNFDHVRFSTRRLRWLRCSRRRGPLACGDVTGAFGMVPSPARAAGASPPPTLGAAGAFSRLGLPSGSPLGALTSEGL